MDKSTAEKYAALRNRLRDLESVAVAFSAGIDSALLLKVAADVLGPENVLAVMARSPSLSVAELASAVAVAEEIGAKLQFVDTHEFDDPRYVANSSERCYFCKSEMFARIAELAVARGFSAVLSGANADDIHDFRPGQKAADECGILSPLAECGLAKAELRQIAAELSLSVHDKPASPCLASRVPYGEPVTPEKLRRIDAAESFLKEQGFKECRVRHHGLLARIEILPDQINRFQDADFRDQVEDRLRRLGFKYVTLDLRGFRSGSLNEVLRDD